MIHKLNECLLLPVWQWSQSKQQNVSALPIAMKWLTMLLASFVFDFSWAIKWTAMLQCLYFSRKWITYKWLNYIYGVCTLNWYQQKDNLTLYLFYFFGQTVVIFLKTRKRFRIEYVIWWSAYRNRFDNFRFYFFAEIWHKATTICFQSVSDSFYFQ